ncbi:MAG: NAD-dependent epimerase/dehydratase family protein [Longimicrobiales bacterium]
MDRRTFIERAAAATGALGALSIPGGLLRAAPAQSLRSARSARALRVLILGGTGFIGPHQVRYVRERGHTLTLFNRGQSNPGMFPDVEQLRGDRNGDLKALEGRQWDAVIDNSGFEPQQVRDSARLLERNVSRYLFVSTQSVYSDRSIVDQDESGAVGTAGVAEDRWRGYGPLKALCEKELVNVFRERAIVVRPAVIVGPGDESDRFTYWVDRIDRGGEVLSPGSPDDPTQFIDVRDLTEWMVRLLESNESGLFNATGPASPLGVAGLLYGIRAVTTKTTKFTWVKAEFLAQMNVRPFSNMPLWYPPVGRTAGFMRMNAGRAISRGLTYRPLAVTAKETLDWWKTLPPERRSDLNAGIPPQREREVLDAWRAQS